MGLQEWKEKVKLLEQGISPDDLPINPEKIPEPGSYPCIVEGYYSYQYYKGSTKEWVKGWYMIKRLGKAKVEEKQL